MRLPPFLFSFVLLDRIGILCFYFSVDHPTNNRRLEFPDRSSTAAVLSFSVIPPLLLLVPPAHGTLFLVAFLSWRCFPRADSVFFSAPLILFLPSQAGMSIPRYDGFGTRCFAPSSNSIPRSFVAHLAGEGSRRLSFLFSSC